MKILMLTPYLPFPIWSGGQIRTYNLLKNLSSKHKITLLSFIREKEEEKYIGELRKYCEKVIIFYKRPPWSFESLLLAGLTFYPLVVCMYLKSEVKRTIQELLDKEKYDLIHAETFYVMPNIPETKIPIILVEQTIEYLVYKHFTKSVKNLLLKIFMKIDVMKINYWEKLFWKKARRVVAMSEADKKIMIKTINNLDVDLVPNGVDTDFFKQKQKNRKNKTVLFVGNFKWLQNKEAAEMLINNIWPMIKKKEKNALLWIVGRHPPLDILRFQSSDVKISSDIHDIRDAYRKSDVLLAPIYGPGGTRYKILESMAMGIPVVSTSTGVEGIDVKNGKHALVYNRWEDLARGTIEVLKNKTLYRSLADNGRDHVKKKFDWKTIAGELDLIYNTACHEEQK